MIKFRLEVFTEVICGFDQPIIQKYSGVCISIKCLFSNDVKTKPATFAVDVKQIISYETRKIDEI